MICVYFEGDVGHTMIFTISRRLLCNGLVVFVLAICEMSGLVFLILPVVIFMKLRKMGAGYFAAIFITTEVVRQI